MTDGYFDIILFAMVAAFLVLRLRSVLGRRTGTEQRRDPFTRPAGPDNVVSLPDRNKAAADSPPSSVAAGVAQIRGADLSCTERWCERQRPWDDPISQATRQLHKCGHIDRRHLQYSRNAHCQFA